MKNEKEGVIHIFFIFIGIALISLGTFYVFTDEKINLDSEDNKVIIKPEEESKDIIKQINLINDIDTKITLKNKNEINIKYSIDSETYLGSFYLNGKEVFKTSSELEQCDQFYLYNNSIVSYCYYGSATSGHLYIINGSKYTKIDKFDDNKMIPEKIQIKDEKLIVNGLGVSEGAILKVVDKEIDLCNEEEVLENNINLQAPAVAEYELIINDNKIELNSIKTTMTLEEFINESCKIVE